MGFSLVVRRPVERRPTEDTAARGPATIEPTAFGWHSHAFVELFCEGRMSGAEVSAAVSKHPEVEGAYTVAGNASAILHVRASDTQHLEDALERIRETPGVLRTQTQVVLSTLFEHPVTNGRVLPKKTRKRR